MADGKEEREERKARLEEESRTRPGDRHDYEPVYEGEPEEGGSWAKGRAKSSTRELLTRSGGAL